MSDAIISKRIMKIRTNARAKLGMTEPFTKCPTCARPFAAPFRRRDDNQRITVGCVDASHTGHVQGDDLVWHNRPSVQLLRAKELSSLQNIDSRRE